METLYKLTDREADTLSNLDQSDVIATGPWRKGFGSLPHRAVIRDLGKEYVVHTQIIDDIVRTAYYEHGSYLPKSLGFAMTWTRFDNRVRNQHNIS